MLPLLVLVIFVNFWAPSISYSTGAPERQCDTLLPFHGGGIPPQSTVSPFRIVTQSAVGQGNILKVEIQANPPELNFHGFMIQARSTSPPYQVVGRFAPAVGDIVKLLNCGGNENTATHSDPSSKSDLGLQWQAPTDFLGEVVFNATVVQDYSTFWVGLESEPVQIVQRGAQLPTTVGISSTRRPLATVRSFSAADTIYDGCGTQKKCYGFPENCIRDKSCQAIVTAKEVGDKYQFELKSDFNKPAYVATGLSPDSVMGDDAVIECVPQQDGTVRAYHSWTSPRPNLGVSRQGIPQNVIRILEGSNVNGAIYCKVEKDAVSTVLGNIFDLKKNKYHVMIATGSAVRESSVAFHNILFHVTQTPLALALTQQTEADPIYEGCGSTKICFGFPDNCVSAKSCRAIATVEGRGEKAVFELKSGFDNPAYVAVGLSTDEKMGDDAVMECIPEGGTVRAYSSFTAPRPNLGVTRENVQQNLVRLIDGSVIDGTIYCKLERDTVSSVRGNTFDLEKTPYNILVATGSSIHDATVGYHNIGRISSQQCQLFNPTCVPGSASKLLLRLHGAFMIVAWIGTASVGIILARYFKQTWVGSSLCGKDQWFAWHRTFMVLTWSLTIAAFVIIFVELGGWSGEDNPHAILGTVTTILCFIQPFGALFRPAPNHKNRPLFNWSHWFIGNAAHLLSIVTIFFAVKLTKAELPEWMDWILVAFVVFHVVMHFILSIAGCFSDRSHTQRVNSFPMDNMSPSRHNNNHKERKMDAPFSGVRKILLTIYLVLVILFVVALVVITVLAPIEDSFSALKSKISN